MEPADNPPKAEFIFDHVSRDLSQVARELGVESQLLRELINHGLLPATKVSASNILIADQDLSIFFPRCCAQRMGNNSNRHDISNSHWEAAEELVEPIKAHLVEHLVFGWVMGEHSKRTPKELNFKTESL